VGWNQSSARIPTSVAQAAKAAAKTSGPRRARRLLRVTKTGEGYKIWLQGETYIVKAPDA